MIGSIRKHSAWLWWLIAGLTIISFIWWGANPSTRNGGGRNGGFGTLYGKKITAEQYSAAQRAFYIDYWLRSGEFPDRNPNFTKTDLERETFVRLMMEEKATTLGIHISPEELVGGANELLRTMGRNGQAVPMAEFSKRVLEPAGLTDADFQHFVQDYLTVQQLVQALGLSGELVPPQAAAQLYDREHQEVSAQAVFFSASNYLSQITATPAAIAQFYTNNMAVYREPDRVQINYLEYNLSNYFAAAEQKLGKTNVTANVESYLAKNGLASVKDAKTPEEAKAKIREAILRESAQPLAVDDAREFAKQLFAMDPVAPENFVKLAKEKGLAVRTTAPFSEAEGPAEMSLPADVAKVAFKLDASSPFAPKPVASTDGIYFFGLAKQIPSAIPSLDEIHARVVEDYKFHEAALRATAAGTNFYFTAAVQMAAGKTFAQAAIAAGQAPQSLSPFSLSSPEIPQAEGHVAADQLKRAAFFDTQPGHISRFEPTEEGGFVLFVQSLLPVDEATKNVDLPKFLTQVRRSQQNEAFNIWLQGEANRELRNTPVYAELNGNKSAPRTP